MSQPRFQQRHQDYVIGPNQDSRLASVTAGQVVNNIQFQFDTDAPFLLRQRAYRVAYNTLGAHLQSGLQNVSLRYTGPQNDYKMDGLIPQGLQMPYGGQSASWKPVYPQVFYPAGSSMLIDVQNTGQTTITNLTLYFRGVKLFAWGSIPAYTYPAKIAKMIPFIYPISPITIANPQGSVQNLLVTDSRLIQPFQCQNDADFVIRAGQAGPSFAPFALEVFVTLRDENRKAFSNDAVHFEVLFGPSTGNYTTAGGQIHSVGTGNANPGIFFPEIYVPKNHMLFFDISRTDAGFAGSATIPNFPINLIGSKVYLA